MIENKPFKEKLTNLATEIISDELKYSGDFFVDKFKPNISPKDEFVINTFLAICEIEIIIQQLNQSPIYISNFRQTKKISENKITRFDHTIYHIESYLFRITGVMDRVLIFMNIIFDLKLKPEQCKPHNFLLNSNNKEGKYAQILKKKKPELFFELNLLLIVIDEFRDIRNEITHQKRFKNEDLKTIEMLDIVQREGNEEFKNSNIKYRIKHATDLIILKYKKNMVLLNDKIQLHINKIYTLSEEIWEENYLNK